MRHRRAYNVRGFGWNGHREIRQFRVILDVFFARGEPPKDAVRARGAEVSRVIFSASPRLRVKPAPSHERKTLHRKEARLLLQEVPIPFEEVLLPSQEVPILFEEVPTPFARGRESLRRDPTPLARGGDPLRRGP
jgi:hypothetical protein